MELRIAHVAEVSKQIRTHIKNYISERALFSPVPEPGEFVSNKLFIIEISIIHSWRQFVEHLGCMTPLLVRQRAPHHVAPELSPVRRLRPRARVGEALEQKGHESHHYENPLRVLRVEP